MNKNWDRIPSRLIRVEQPLENIDDQSNNGENHEEHKEIPNEQTFNAP